MAKQPLSKGKHMTADNTLVRHGQCTAAAALRRSFAQVERFPDPNDDNQTWPVRVFTLGRFEVLIEDQQPAIGRKTPHRPLTLLKALIAMGGRRVSCDRLASALWPDADGDTARKSFDTTLYRLRKLLAHEQALLCTESTLSLDARYCWVDAWAFEHLIGKIRRAIHDSDVEMTPVTMQQLCDQLFHLYQNHFLRQDDDMHWAVSMRERLRSKFVNFLVDCGRYWEHRSNWRLALDCYQRGLDVDDLVEVFFQRMMVCYLELGRISEGMAAYRRCKLLLSVVLGLRPESATESIHEELMHARLKSRHV